MVEAYGESIISKLKVEHTQHGECISLDPVAVIAYTYSSFGKELLAKECQSALAISIDMAMLLANHYGSLVGFKIQDPHATNPWEGLPLKRCRVLTQSFQLAYLLQKRPRNGSKCSNHSLSRPWP